MHPPKSQSTASSTNSSSTGNRPIVILIEDDNRVAPALGMLIEDWGYECLAVRTPSAAADRLGERIAEAIAIVADLSRYDAFTGRRSAEAIISALGTEIPLLVTTNEPALAEEHGYTDVLEKPYDPETLKDWLKRQGGRRNRGAKAVPTLRSC